MMAKMEAAKTSLYTGFRALSDLSILDRVWLGGVQIFSLCRLSGGGVSQFFHVIGYKFWRGVILTPGFFFEGKTLRSFVNRPVQVSTQFQQCQ